MKRTRISALLGGVLVITAIAMVAAAASKSAVSGAASSNPVLGKVTRVGTASLNAGAASAKGDPTGPLATEIRPESEGVEPEIPNKGHTSATSPPKGLPSVAGMTVSNSDALLSVDGLTHYDQRNAGTGAFANTQFSLEPPDQGICVGNGYLLETVNTVLRVKNASTGANVTNVIPINQFFGLAPEIVRPPNPISYGPFTSDPKCYFDPATSRWFLTILEVDTNPSTGAFEDSSSVLIAVSQTADPTGAWNVYSLDTTNDGSNGTPDHPGCPCLGDQPLIGADANAFFVSTNEYSLEPFGAYFNGAQIYAIDKAALAAGTSANAVLFEGGPLEEGISYSVQPATVPPGGTFASTNGGTEYFLSALEFGAPDNRIAVWAVSNTSTIGNTTPNLHIAHSIVETQTYMAPVATAQRSAPAGLLPFGKKGIKAFYGFPSQPQELIESNDDRMQQVVFAAGKLWSGLNTSMVLATGNVNAGVAYFVVTPTSGGSATSPTVSGTVAKQGYVGVEKANAVFPSIGVNSSGEGVMTFSLMGNDYWPSSAYVRIDATDGVSGPVRIAGAGALPDDGYTGYTPFTGTNVARWGDYSAAVADDSGNIWIASEYIPDSPRTLVANWGTKISKVAP
jgi:hypothetical protein